MRSSTRSNGGRRFLARAPGWVWQSRRPLRMPIVGRSGSRIIPAEAAFFTWRCRRLLWAARSCTQNPLRCKIGNDETSNKSVRQPDGASCYWSFSACGLLPQKYCPPCVPFNDVSAGAHISPAGIRSHNLAGAARPSRRAAGRRFRKIFEMERLISRAANMPTRHTLTINISSRISSPSSRTQPRSSWASRWLWRAHRPIVAPGHRSSSSSCFPISRKVLTARRHASFSASKATSTN